MNRELRVFVDLNREAIRVGTLWTRSARGRGATASFQYDNAWLAHPAAFPLGPSLPLVRGSAHTNRQLFSAFSDAAPDRWGEVLLQRAEDKRLRKLGPTGRKLQAADFLAGVNDETRMGALRFKQPGEDSFLSRSENPVPALVHLRKLLSAASRVLRDKESEADLQLLLAPGSSLGGQRPKASVRNNDGRLLIAKFPKNDDTWSVPRWEAATLALAESAQISVPRWSLQLPTRSKPTVLTERFDRFGVDVRIPFMSALTALDALDNDGGSYLDIAEVLRRDGASPSEDLRELWRRMVFNILVSNADDHLRNHGFLRVASGWRLSPAYDLNPSPEKAGLHALAFNDHERTASLDVVLSVAPQFGLTTADARSIASTVAFGVAKWKDAAKRSGISKPEIDRMALAFEHEHLATALKLGTVSAPSTPKKKSKKSKWASERA